jgi:hypothetical protein
MANPPSYNIWLAWYAIQSYSMDFYVYMRQLDVIEKYIAASPIPYNRLILYLDAPENGDNKNIPNVECFPQAVAQILVDIPAKTAGKITLTGGKFNFADDAGWVINENVIFQGQPSDYPNPISKTVSDWTSKPFTFPNPNPACATGAANAQMSFPNATNQFYGYNGPKDDTVLVTSVNSAGFPYQALNATQCVYDSPRGKGCPSQISECAWWVMLVNRFARQNPGYTGNPAQQITVIGFETESAGTGGEVYCNAFQFLYAILQFGGTAEDIFPAGQKLSF